MKTPLYETHVAAGGHMVEFCGWELPVQYAGIVKEHTAVRTAAGLFDVSHMGEIELKGRDALSFLNSAVTSDMSPLQPGQVGYAVLCNDAGFALDDLLVHKMGEGEGFVIVANAANTPRVVAELTALAAAFDGEALVKDVSSEWAQLALQGPRAAEIIATISDVDLTMGYYHFAAGRVMGLGCWIARTGYTGEDGFEVYCKPSDAVTLWEALMAAGAPFGLIPCGLGARDTLRLEAAMPLYGHELSEEITPLEAGLSRFVSFDKGPFRGREALLAAKPPKRRRIGLVLEGRSVPRQGFTVFCQGRAVGAVSSGTSSPTLQKSIAMAYVEADCFKEPVFEVEIRGKLVPAARVKLPFYHKS